MDDFFEVSVTVPVQEVFVQNIVAGDRVVIGGRIQRVLSNGGGRIVFEHGDWGTSSMPANFLGESLKVVSCVL